MSARLTGCKCAALLLGISLVGGCATHMPQMEPSCAGSIPLVSALEQPAVAQAQPVKRVYTKKKTTATKRAVRKTVRRTPVKKRVTRVARAPKRQTVTPPIPLPLDPVTPLAPVEASYHHIPDRLQ